MTFQVRHFEYLNECHSTQIILKGKVDADIGDVVSTERQTHGEGRHQRKWMDSSGSVAFSLILPQLKNLSWESLYVGVLVSDFFQEKWGQRLMLKWPNDLMNQQGEKCGGILVDIHQQKAVVGIGLNIYHEADFSYTSIFQDHSPTTFSKKQFSFDLSSYLLNHFECDPSLLKQRWEEKCIHLSKVVRIEDQSQTIKGHFIGLGSFGQALIETPGGIKECFTGSLFRGNE